MLNREGILKAARESVFETTQRTPKDSAPLVSSGLIDSLAVMKLIFRLEQKLDIPIPMDKVQPEDFDSIELIVETIQRVIAR